MRTSDAAEILELARLNPLWYSVGVERHDSLCLVHERGVWKVFVGERGRRFEERAFNQDEDAACVYFVKRALQLLLGSEA